MNQGLDDSTEAAIAASIELQLLYDAGAAEPPFAAAESAQRPDHDDAPPPPPDPRDGLGLVEDGDEDTTQSGWSNNRRYFSFTSLRDDKNDRPSTVLGSLNSSLCMLAWSDACICCLQGVTRKNKGPTTVCAACTKVCFSAC